MDLRPGEIGRFQERLITADYARTAHSFVSLLKEGEELTRLQVFTRGGHLNVLDPGYEAGSCGEPAQPCGSENGGTRSLHSLPTLNGPAKG